MKAYVADASKGCWRSPVQVSGAGWAAAEAISGAVVGVVVLVVGVVVLVVGVVVLVVGAVIGAVEGVPTTRALSPVVFGLTAGAAVIGVTSLTGWAGDVVAVLVVVDGAGGETPVDPRFVGAALSCTRIAWLPE